MAKQLDWFNSYIYYSYDDYRLKSPNAAKVRAFYNSKNEILGQQLRRADYQIRSIKRKTPEGLAKLVNVLTTSTDPIAALYAKAGLSEAKEITSSSNAGFKIASARTIKNSEKYFRDLSQAEKNADKWAQVASQYSTRVTKLFTDLMTYFTGAALQESLLEKLHNKQPLDAAERAAISSILSKR